MTQTQDEIVNSKSEFLEELEFPSATMNAALVGRGSGTVYEQTATSSQRASVRYELEKGLLDLAARYPSNAAETAVGDDAHVSNIAELAERVSREAGKYLVGGNFTIGRAQKALNLYLKYLWCTGRKLMPPHCPFDGIVIERLGKIAKMPLALAQWTAITEKDRYVELVSAARDRIKNKPLAVWELREWNAYQMRLRNLYWSSK